LIAVRYTKTGNNMTTKQRPNHSKLRELILRISKLCEGDSHFGAVKLNKLLFYSDFNAYVQLGRTITGQAYKKSELGPVPKKIEETLAHMERKRDISIRNENVPGGYVQRRAIPLRDAKVNMFTVDELSIIDDVICRFHDTTAMDLSELSHEFLAWNVCQLREDIPMEATLCNKPVLTDREIRAGKALEESARKLLEAA